ncbi:hypothetical protein [Flavobacterium caeni]|uniref:Lipoprotein n=1 Tax=Flavobacterium caeni TaxID=490189 RepID=A0A1G5G5E7_9FLAO|nr:hypothetical protein [Flavobacterium caeni]SCY46775.1 hypothetical protein SAMN02927903_01455 [Flavobacterium caeni]
MKTKFLLLAFAATLFLNSCSSDDDEDGIYTPPVGSGEISGNATSNQNFIKGNYTLRGVYKIKAGVTVTFDAGSTITADVTNGTDAIVVENGGKLIMNGSAAEPIVCTEVSKVPGSWGGIIMYGDAPIVGAAGVGTATAEDGLTNDANTAYTYGGSNAAHNGGSLRYVRVEYAGKKITDGTSEMNGFSFYSVGTGTVLENLVSYKGADDGFEFYGGTVSATNLISYGNYDDSFDWQDGWRGQSNSNWYAYQVGTGNFGMEIEAKSYNNAFWPVINNITLKRAAGTITEGGSSAAEYDAIQFKKQGNGAFSNILISGYTTSGSTAVRIQDAATNTDQVNTGKIKLLNVQITDGTSQFGGATGFTVDFLGTNYTLGTTTGASITPGAWAVVDGVNLLQ